MKKIIIIILFSTIIITSLPAQNEIPCQCKNTLGQKTEDTIDSILTKKFGNELGHRLTEKFPNLPSQSQVLLAHIRWTGENYEVDIKTRKRNDYYSLFFKQTITNLLSNIVELDEKIIVIPLVMVGMDGPIPIGITKKDCKFYQRKMKKLKRRKKIHITRKRCFIWMAVIKDN